MQQRLRFGLGDEGLVENQLALVGAQSALVDQVGGPGEGDHACAWKLLDAGTETEKGSRRATEREPLEVREAGLFFN